MTTVESTIRVRGARTHNLREIDVDLPKGKLVVFTGVSGSGKSSLAFDTIAAESQRLLNETYPGFVQSLMPSLPRPEIEEITGLTAAILVGQDTMTANPRSTVGTATDAWTYLRAVYAAFGDPVVPSPTYLYTTQPDGMCAECQGTGQQTDLNPNEVLDPTKSLNDGAIAFPNFGVNSLFWKVYARSGYFDADLPVGQFTVGQREQLLRGKGPNVDTGSYPMAYEGLLDKINRLYLSKPVDTLKPKIREALTRVANRNRCGECVGAGLSQPGRDCLIGGLNIIDAAALPVTQLDAHLADHSEQKAAVVERLRRLLHALDGVGLGYLSIDRRASTLSGGEAQRLRTVRHLDSALTGLTYVFDEPSAGLHPDDVSRTLHVLTQLRDKGNTVLVVEHNPAVIAAADHIVDLGPGPGVHGGTITFTGDYQALLTTDTSTADHLSRTVELNQEPRTRTGTIRVVQATRNNLRNLTVDIPAGVLTVITGVSGSGKTSLLDSIPTDQNTARLTQTPISGSRRSSLATYTGLLDSIRTTFAKATGAPAKMFSANSEGACSTCRGLGVTYTEIPFLDPVPVTCTTCDGRRYTQQVLAHTVDGRSIADILSLTVEDAPHVLTATDPQLTLLALSNVGLGYLSLGQTLTTLSGGERQRLELALSIRDGSSILLLDEPTSGLHLSDVYTLTRFFRRLVDDGRTIVATDHHLQLIAAADHLIDLGPGAGQAGGRIVATGTPTDLVSHSDSLTGQFLARSLPAQIA
ncbi:MAG: ATP-binding cassette domain-containing protein [Brevibacterium sp.]